MIISEEDVDTVLEMVRQLVRDKMCIRDRAKEALRLATHKLPCKCKVVSRADLEGGDNSEN